MPSCFANFYLCHGNGQQKLERRKLRQKKNIGWVDHLDPHNHFSFKIRSQSSVWNELDIFIWQHKIALYSPDVAFSLSTCPVSGYLREEISISLFISLSQGTIEWCGCPSASFSPNLKTPKSLATTHRTFLPALSPGLVPSHGHTLLSHSS